MTVTLICDCHLALIETENRRDAKILRLYRLWRGLRRGQPPQPGEGFAGFEVEVVFGEGGLRHPGVGFELGVEHDGFARCKAGVQQEDHVDGALCAVAEALGVETIGEEERLDAG